MTEQRRFGRTGLKVAPLSFGTMTLGEPVDEKTSYELLDLALERGVNFLDCANMYNAGFTETVLGRWFASRGVRERVILSSKVRYRVGDDELSEGLSPATIERELHRSLERLKTDYLDIYFLHQPDYDTPIDVTWQCLDRLAREGKFRYVGLSNFAAWQIVEADHMARAAGWIRPTVVQTMYNLIARKAEDELLPMSAVYDLGTCNYNPLAGGLLTGKYGTASEAETGRLSHNETYRKRYFDDRQREAAARIADIAREHGRGAVELALRFCLDNEAISTVLLGATSAAQLNEGLDALDAAPLTDEERARCDAAWRELSGPVPAYNR
jgi:aryl-alcohol dehydrogenase-like predicted oxidoreductase